MKSIKLLAVFFFLTAGIISAQSVPWKIDQAHSKVQFTVSHMVVSEVTGHFKKFDGKITSDGEDFTKGNVEFTINAASIDTDNEKRDEHLRSDDFFNAEKYPEIIFKGKSLKKVGNNKYKLKGDFTMRNVTKPVELDVVYGGIVKDPYGNTHTGFKITGKVNRFDYGLKWNNLMEAGGAVVGKDVDIVVNLELTKEKSS